MANPDFRTTGCPDRRSAPRGGRRTGDIAGRHPAVLVVDADASVRRTCVQFLMRRGFQVGEAGGGTEATAAIASTRPSVALVDLALPAGRTLLPSAESAGVPVIIMTTDFLEYPPDAPNVLVKPFSLETMLTAIRRVLGAASAAASMT